MLNESFYPTPKTLIRRMYETIKGKDITTILEPSAGKGDIIDFLQDQYHHRRVEISAIEKDETLRATLTGKGIKIIDSDFLTFAGADKFDLIIMNPPFKDGDQHLLKALDIMYNGEIVCLLNAQTLKNAHTNIRQRLIKKLTKHRAKVQYIKLAFQQAERRTEVEVALVYVKIENNIESDLFKDMDDKPKPQPEETVEDSKEVATLKSIKNLVDDYNRVIRIGQETLVDYYKNYRHIGQFIKLKNDGDKLNYGTGGDTLTVIMKNKLNQFLKDVREHYWKSALSLDAVTKRLTSAKRDEFCSRMNKQAEMEFTENNIRQFILNLIDSYEETLTAAVVKLFDTMSTKHAWDEDLHNGNVHYFNGWKTNKAFYINKKVIMPWYNFIGYSGQWKVDYQDQGKMDDIDLVMSYFSGCHRAIPIRSALEQSFTNDQNRNVNSDYFTISAFKKGTIHLTFKDEDILRRFNVTACKGKGWLPQDYGIKPFSQLSYEKQQVVKAFEDEKTYDKNIGKEMFRIKNPAKLMLEGGKDHEENTRINND